MLEGRQQQGVLGVDDLRFLLGEGDQLGAGEDGPFEFKPARGLERFELRGRDRTNPAKSGRDSTCCWASSRVM